MNPSAEEVICRGRFPGSEDLLDIVVSRGKIVRVECAATTPADFGSPEAYFGPALFDIQVNGAAGINLQGAQLTLEQVQQLNKHLASQGVSCWVPTLVTASLEEMEHGCRALAAAMEQPRLREAIPGLHLEGPVISPEDGPRGAHPRAHVRPPDLQDFDRLHKAAHGRVLYTTVAPDQAGAAEYIAGVVARGTAVSLGHHNATREQIAAAVDAGATLCTHLGNGAASQIHRHNNVLWPQMAEDRLHASLIADRHHLPADMLKVLVRAKQPERIVLTSDCVDLAGMPPGEYEFAGAKVELRADGKICLLGTDLLAGSSLMLLQGVVNMWQSGAMTLEQALASASTIPARLFGVRRTFGLPKVGKADFLLFELRENTPKILVSYVNGERAA